MSEVRRGRPALVVDAVAPGSLEFTNPKSEGITSFPALAAWVDRGYQALPSAPDCPRVYVRNDLVDQRQGAFIRARRITASAHRVKDGEAFTPELVDDGQSFEVCRDRWLLPDGQLGELRLELEKTEVIGTVKILNTSNAPSRDRATRSAVVTFERQGAAVAIVPVRIQRYPYWTTITTPGVSADAVRITITGFEGKGAGLNEVKIVAPRRAE